MGAPRQADWREERCKRAWELKDQGSPQKEIVEALGVSIGNVCCSDLDQLQRALIRA